MRVLILSLFVVVALAERVRYDGYQTLRIVPKNEQQQSFVDHLAETASELDFWAHSPADVMVPPRFLSGFKVLLDQNDIDYSVMIDDVQALIDAQPVRDTPSATFDYSVYHSYEEIQQWVSDMAEQYSIATQVQVATSTEGRAINGLQISSGGANKKMVYWQGGIHAREWISPATVMYITKTILEGDFSTYLNEFDFIIVPSLNVDGYVYTHTDDRMWRKTRSPIDGSNQVGVDPNRNYGYEWGGDGASTNPRSETYRGPYANSEPEVSGSTEYLLNLRNQGTEFASFIDFHSYSQLWLAPWSYSKTAFLPSETNDQISASVAACDALQAVYGTTYTYGPSARTLYAASGCSVDWGFATLEAKYSYVVELRDTGNYGFILPENQIIPTGEETFAGVKAYLDYIIQNS